MNKPKIAATEPQPVNLEAGKKYAWCSCGHSQTQPFCDGSHKEQGFKPVIFTAEESGEAWLCMCKQTATPPFCDGSHANCTDEPT
ncbi:CDGSH iron-sulfur domain-containing protein [Magnetovibrio blakemorei]|uniref:Glutamate synthase n=1 Tax=Magnetovibrio blakemorei TaxID=28181 RepID=A0A1E5Q9F9_9PROT|nr:CDGSH iron-sulfur domain-containing protein [Magnetovibrio blakemorei]OEJ68136.1 glutamate synthase [Magnetovibrio blakemorei]